jgi:hypothetical protein
MFFAHIPKLRKTVNVDMWGRCTEIYAADSPNEHKSLAKKMQISIVCALSINDVVKDQICLCMYVT